MKKNRNWIWYFVVLVVLGVIALTIPIVYNLRKQLTLEEMKKAQAFWEANKPADYDLEYSKQGNVNDTFLVEVRKGNVVSVRRRISDGKDVLLRPDQFDHHSIGGILKDLELLLRQDTKPKAPRSYNRAVFDDEDGHLIHFVRSVSQTDYRIEIRVKFKKLP